MKSLLKIIVALIPVFAMPVGAVFSFPDSGIEQAVEKQAVETYGPQYTKSSVEPAGINLAPLSAGDSLTELVVGNPEGFQTGHALSLGEITLAPDTDTDTDTVKGDPVLIDSLRILAPEFTFEQSVGGSNLQQSRKNVAAFTGASTAVATDDTRNPQSGTGPILLAAKCKAHTHFWRLNQSIGIAL